MNGELFAKMAQSYVDSVASGEGEAPRHFVTTKTWKCACTINTPKGPSASSPLLTISSNPRTLELLMRPFHPTKAA